MPRVINVGDPEAFSRILNAKGRFGESTGVVVDFSATWCGPCKAFAPIFDAMSDDPAYSKVHFLKVDVDELQEVAQQCQIRAMPTVQAYVNAEKVDEFVGADKGKLTSMLNKVAGLVSASTAGAGRKLGGDDGAATAAAADGGAAAAAAAGLDDAAARRARMAAAAEARMRTAAS